MKLFKFKCWVRVKKRQPQGQRKGGAASSSSSSLILGCLACWALPNHVGWSVLAHIVFFSHWVQQLRRGLGDCFLLNVANSQENTVHIFLSALPVTKYLRGSFVQDIKHRGQHLIKSLQNCLLTVLNVRHLCNLNVRYRF